MSKSIFRLFFATAVCATPLTAASGQEVDVDAGPTGVQVQQDDVDVDVDRAERRTRTDAATTSRSDERLNSEIATWSLADQRAIVELAEFGAERTKTPEVQQLADMIAEEHRQLAEKLAGFTRRSATTDRVDSDSSDDGERRRRLRDRRQATDQSEDQDRRPVRDRRPLENLAERLETGVERLADRAEQAVEATRDAVDRSIAGEEAPGRFVATRSFWPDLHREITDRVTATAKRDLEQYQGYEFDASFVGILVAAHLNQEATLEVLQQRASGDLAETLGNAVSAIRQHRQQAEQVMENIKPSR